MLEAMIQLTLMKPSSPGDLSYSPFDELISYLAWWKVSTRERYMEMMITDLHIVCQNYLYIYMQLRNLDVCNNLLAAFQRKRMLIICGCLMSVFDFFTYVFFLLELKGSYRK